MKKISFIQSATQTTKFHYNDYDGGCKEHRGLCWAWGDVKLHKTANGVEYLEFNERQTKTRTVSDLSGVVRAVPPKMSATEGTDRAPVAVYIFVLPGRGLKK